MEARRAKRTCAGCVRKSAPGVTYDERTSYVTREKEGAQVYSEGTMALRGSRPEGQNKDAQVRCACVDGIAYLSSRSCGYSVEK